jgi:hypothetical protein
MCVSGRVSGDLTRIEEARREGGREGGREGRTCGTTLARGLSAARGIQRASHNRPSPP